MNTPKRVYYFAMVRAEGVNVDVFAPCKDAEDYAMARRRLPYRVETALPLSIAYVIYSNVVLMQPEVNLLVGAGADIVLSGVSVYYEDV